MNPRDADIIGIPRLHRLIRRSTSYGPMLPDGVDDGRFIGAPDEQDPLVGANDGSAQFTIPQRPIRRRLTDLPSFVDNRGGEYCFVPSLSALRWLSELDT